MKTEHGIFAAGLIVLIGAVAWSGLTEFKSKSADGSGRAVLPHKVESTPLAIQQEGSPEAFVWGKSLSQDRGPEWNYDLFTPPKITFDRKKGKWRAGDDVDKYPAENMATDDLALLEVIAIPYPLQLVGYSGEGAGLHGLFSKEDGGQLMWLRAGDRIAVENVEIVSLGLKSEDGRYAVATIKEVRTGNEVHLVQGEIIPSGQWGARIRGVPGLRREGEYFEHASKNYLVRKISMDPLFVELTVDRPEVAVRILTMKTENKGEQP